MAKNDGGPAFPEHIYREDIQAITTELGMSLRDWFAGHATEEDIEVYSKMEYVKDMMIKRPTVTREAAKYAYADAMLKERTKEDGGRETDGSKPE